MPKVRKNKTQFKNKKEEILKEEAKKALSRKKWIKKITEQILKQENCGEEVKTEVLLCIITEIHLLYCFKCIIVLYRSIGNFLAFHHSKNLEILLQDWNTSGESSLQSFVFLDDKKLKNFWDTIKWSQRSSCRSNCALQLLLVTPFQKILIQTTSTI